MLNYYRTNNCSCINLCFYKKGLFTDNEKCHKILPKRDTILIKML